MFCCFVQACGARSVNLYSIFRFAAAGPASVSCLFTVLLPPLCTCVSTAPFCKKHSSSSQQCACVCTLPCRAAGRNARGCASRAQLAAVRARVDGVIAAEALQPRATNTADGAQPLPPATSNPKTRAPPNAGASDANSQRASDAISPRTCRSAHPASQARDGPPAAAQISCRRCAPRRSGAASHNTLEVAAVRGASCAPRRRKQAKRNRRAAHAQRVPTIAVAARAGTRAALAL